MRSHGVDMHRGIPERNTRRTTRGASGRLWVENRKERSMSGFSLQEQRGIAIVRTEIR